MATKDTGRIVLSQQILRNLGDRSYEKRKQAAIEIEHIIRDFHPSQGNNAEKIKQVIHSLVTEYAYSTQPNNRKGGLIGLSAIAIALMDNASAFLELLLPPVLKCFTDPEARVRYYACEALYNITKVARGNVLLFFNEIFDGLCQLFADMDVDVKSGAQLLDRLIKDVVTESEAFDVERFIPLLRERIKIKNPFIRQLIVGWISVLDSVPDIDMLEFLPEYVGGLFDMLSDPNKDIRQQAYSALAELLRQINVSPHVELGSMVMILVQQCDSKDNFTRLTVLSWIHDFIILGKAKLLHFIPDLLGAIFVCFSDVEREIRLKAQQCQDVLLRLVEDTQEPVDLAALVRKLTAQLVNRWVNARLAALRWIAMLLTKNTGGLTAHSDTLFPALLMTLQDVDDQVVRLDLEVLARMSLNDQGQLDMTSFEMVLSHLVRLFAADVKFLERRGTLIIRQLSLLLSGEPLYRTLAKLLRTHDDVEFAGQLVQTLNLILLTSTELFELRAAIKVAMASEEGRDLFRCLYIAWAHSPVATLSLCLLAQAYELAAALTLAIADMDVTVGLLLQLDKLVQIIESPIFVHLRLQLLEPQRYPYLTKALYGVLMLLPQSSAFTSLRTRLASVSPLGALSCIPPSKHAISLAAEMAPTSDSSSLLTTSPNKSGDKKKGDKVASIESEQKSGSSTSSSTTTTTSISITSSSTNDDLDKLALNLDALLAHFGAVQHLHQQRRRKLSRAASLLELPRRAPPQSQLTFSGAAAAAYVAHAANSQNVNGTNSSSSSGSSNSSSSSSSSSSSVNGTSSNNSSSNNTPNNITTTPSGNSSSSS